jgi:hypothetical protein
MMPIDYSKYPQNWKSEIVPRILKRAKNRCEFCGVRNHTNVYVVKLYCKTDKGQYGWRSIWFRSEGDAKKIRNLKRTGTNIVRVALEIAHLDHDETNHDVADDRLAALCQYCHLNFDAREKYERAYLGKGREGE